MVKLNRSIGTWPLGVKDDTKWNQAEMGAFIEKNKLFFDAFDRAVSKNEYQFPGIADMSDVTPETVFPPMNTYRQSAYLANSQALFEFRNGQEEKGLRRAVNIMKFGSLLEEPNNSLIGYHVGRSVKSITLTTLRMMTSEIHSSKYLSLLIPQLVLYKEKGELSAALKAEYMVDVNIADAIALRKYSGGDSWRGSTDSMDFVSTALMKSHYYYRPNKTRELFMDSFLSVVQNAEQENCLIATQYQNEETNKAEAILSDRRLSFTIFDTDITPIAWIRMLLEENIFGKSLSNIMSSVFSPLVNKKCAADFSLEATRVLMALRMYYDDHGRTLPDSLDELVPAYIDNIPTDPFDGKEIKYSKDKKIIYSVGPDKKDDGGESKENLESNAKDPTILVNFK